MRPGLCLIPLLFSSLAFGQTLREWGAMRRVLIGAAVNPARFSETAFADTLRTEFSQVTAENVMKWNTIHPAVNTYNYAPADTILNFAAENDMQVRGHVLVWHSQNPAWLTSGKYSPAQLAELMRSHVSEVAGHYAGKVFAWDVVNEAFNEDGTLRSTIWYDQPGIGLTGTGYIERAFRWAREADPGGLLFYNDFNIETINPKSNEVFRMVQDFKRRGVPIDGVGLQGHLDRNFDASSIISLEANIKRFTELGLQVHITELDVRLPVAGTGPAPNDLAAQATIYEGVTRGCLKFPMCTSIQFWGFTDKYSWVTGTFPGFGAALPFDANYGRKPAYLSMTAALSTAPPVIAGAGLVNAASYEGGGVSPGEIVAFYSPSFGPGALAPATADADSRLPTTLAETQILFDDIPAPLIYARAGQVGAIVPFGVAGKKSAQVQYRYKGVNSNTVTVPVLAQKPGLFTINASGTGPAAILDSSNPVARGSIVSVFLTGAGRTEPGTDGQIATGLPLPVLSSEITAQIGGQTAEILYAGGAAGMVHGGVQLNLRVPGGIPPGSQPVVVSIGGRQSQPGVTLNVK
jgi:endo-1,4-beta-xylanase